MNLPEAIKILTERYRIGDPLKNPAYEIALKLGIEALKHMKSERTIYGYKRHFPLPGETDSEELYRRLFMRSPVIKKKGGQK